MSLIPYIGGSGCSLSTPYPVLTGDNYTVWAIKVEANLDAAGLWEAVVPAEDAAAAVITKKDKLARAYLLRALSEEILLQVSSKNTTAELWASLKTRFIGTNRVRAARLATLRGEFERLRTAESEMLDAFAGKIGGMVARYAGLGSTLDDAGMVKKLLDSVPDRLYAAVTGIEQFCDISTMAFEEALGQLKTFEERSRRRAQGGGERADEQLMLTAAQWEARKRQRGGVHDHEDDGSSSEASGARRRRGKCFNCDVRGHFSRDCQKPKKADEEKALLADIDDEPALL